MKPRADKHSSKNQMFPISLDPMEILWSGLGGGRCVPKRRLLALLFPALAEQAEGWLTPPAKRLSSS